MHDATAAVNTAVNKLLTSAAVKRPKCKRNGRQHSTKTEGRTSSTELATDLVWRSCLCCHARGE